MGRKVAQKRKQFAPNWLASQEQNQELNSGDLLYFSYTMNLYFIVGRPGQQMGSEAWVFLLQTFLSFQIFSFPTSKSNWAPSKMRKRLSALLK